MSAGPKNAEGWVLLAPAVLSTSDLTASYQTKGATTAATTTSRTAARSGASRVLGLLTRTKASMPRPITGRYSV